MGQSELAECEVAERQPGGDRSDVLHEVGASYTRWPQKRRRDLERNASAGWLCRNLAVRSRPVVRRYLVRLCDAGWAGTDWSLGSDLWVRTLDHRCVQQIMEDYTVTNVPL